MIVLTDKTWLKGFEASERLQSMLMRIVNVTVFVRSVENSVILIAILIW